MKEIPLTQDKIALVDDQDYEWLTQIKWAAAFKPDSKCYYALGYLGSRPTRKMVKMHRLILNAKAGQLVDHINHDTLNNMRSNLRICTLSQNTANSRIHFNNKAGYKGVIYRRGKWETSIKCGGLYHWIGSFHNALDAALAYDTAAIKYFGEFALTNAMLGLLEAA